MLSFKHWMHPNTFCLFVVTLDLCQKVMLSRVRLPVHLYPMTGLGRGKFHLNPALSPPGDMLSV